MKNKVVLFGYSGHALVVFDTLNQARYEVIGYFDRKEVVNNILGIPYLGFEKNIEDFDRIRGILTFPAIGDNHQREKVTILLKSEDFIIPVAVSPNANVSRHSAIQNGTLVCQGACVNAFTDIGHGVIINTAAVIEHECQISDFCHIGPGAVLAGNVKVDKCSFVGANSVVKQGVQIGKNVIIGAGSVVLKNVPDNLIIVGNPVRIINK